MTPDAFDALATLLRMRGASREAARLVLVDEVPPAVAARAVGITPAGVSNAVAAARRGLELARAAMAA